MVFAEPTGKTTPQAKSDTLSRNSRESGIAPVLNPFPMEK